MARKKSSHKQTKSAQGKASRKQWPFAKKRVPRCVFFFSALQRGGRGVLGLGAGEPVKAKLFRNSVLKWRSFLMNDVR